MEFDYDPKRAKEELVYLKEIVVHLQLFLKFVNEFKEILPRDYSYSYHAVDYVNYHEFRLRAQLVASG